VFSSDSGRPWRYAHASVVGRSHVASEIPCQDASACEDLYLAGASTLFGIVSDGAGSAPLSQIGARFACEVILDEARAALASGGGVGALDQEFAYGSLERFQHALARVARRAGRPVRDFACTLLWAACDDQRASFAQVGDGAIVVSAAQPPGAWRGFDWVFWPQQGEYVNQTNFAHDPRAFESLQFEARAQRVEELAVFSDGLQGLVLDVRRRVAHQRFFEPMFAAIRGSEPGRSESHCRSLQRFLASPTIETRTDDDKSLILASRRAPEPRPVLPVAPAQPAAVASAPEAQELRG
jgi:hypothetical protein